MFPGLEGALCILSGSFLRTETRLLLLGPGPREPTVSHQRDASRGDASTGVSGKASLTIGEGIGDWGRRCLAWVLGEFRQPGLGPDGGAGGNDEEQLEQRGARKQMWAVGTGMRRVGLGVTRPGRRRRVGQAHARAWTGKHSRQNPRESKPQH